MQQKQLGLVVYSKPACVQCTSTYRFLDARQVDYTVIDISVDDAALAMVKALGYLAAPVVVLETLTGTEHWAGFRPDKLTTFDADLPRLEVAAAA
ncbi:NrdH-redoxin [Rathayibacter iranicus]|uniref:Glutaredoxin-like protein NrdH n=2 Tax=Rathayibacter iranicus TaxID=59737 RepID=A0AAD1AI97_9MICO|nr:glutaredoxin-like protein NrdH [Rathayibacter iranicus]MWV32267.1 glutaredoxin-like protein NrdH [Rathayibacter iranicus NCPPB 2253 = VKM Ac-1602]PPI62410.1 NrdH-redoxin [Rathayibacter iranicus]